MITVDRNHLFKGAPNIDTFISRALSVGFCFFAFLCLGDLVPDFPGDPVYDFLNLSGFAMCGFATEAMLPADVAPAVACSSMSCIFMLIFIL